jgi:hypothetical protein
MHHGGNMSVIGFDIVAGLALYVVVMLWKIAGYLSVIANNSAKG